MNRATAHLQGKQQSSFSKFNMEQGFKIAIWMLCLIGYLQANPLTRSPVSMADLGIVYLQEPEVKCGNLTFTHPTNVKESCRHAAVQHFIGQLELARCDDRNGRINGTLQTLEEKVLQLVLTTTSTCKLETETSQFETFVKAIETFVQNLNSNLRRSGK